MECDISIKSMYCGLLYNLQFLILVFYKMDCDFKIFRKTTSNKVIAIAVWKSNPTYIFNISQGMAWWAVNSKVLFPDWNVRFYIDKDISKHMKNDIDWDMLLTSLKRFNNIELWFYDCDSGKKDNKHIRTFGSLVRFHALTDSSLQCRIFRNVELLTSPKEARLIHQWVLSDKDYLIYFDIEDGYPCNYGNKKLCKQVGLINKYMILATFGSKNTFPNYLKDSYNLCVDYGMLNYPYGVDEICLTILVKPYLNLDNTFLIPRQFFNQVFPSTYTIYYEAIDPTKTANQINVDISRIENDIEKMFEIIIPLRKKFNDNDIDNLQERMNKYYLNIFLNDQEVSNFLDTIDENEREKAISLCLKYIIFENIDWPGGVLKDKTLNIFSAPDKMSLDESKKDIIALLKRTRRPPLDEESLNKKALQNIEHQYKKDLENFKHNSTIFLKNTRNVYLSRDEDYKN